jgi:alpha-L-fucosidase
MKALTAIIYLVLANAAFPQVHEHHVAIDPSDTPQSITEKAARVVPNKAQMIHHRSEYNGFIHFGPNTFTGVDWGSGEEDPKVFNPPQVDTDQWCRIMKEAGMRMVVITVKHHEGYCLWQTRYNDTFSVKTSPWSDGKGDVLRKLADSCAKYGLRLGVYLSPADLYEMRDGGHYGNESETRESVIPTDPASMVSDPMKPREAPEGKPTFKVRADDYNRYFMNQLYELLTEYGPIHEVWFDGAHPKRKGDQQYARLEWLRMIRELAPEAAIFGGPDVRWCGNEAGHTRDSEWNILPVQDLATSGYDRPQDDVGSDEKITAKSYMVYEEEFRSNYLYYLIAETDTSIRNTWYWRNDTDQPMRDADDVFDIYERSVGGNSVFLLNIPPNQEGRFSPRDEASLIEAGRRIRETYGTNLAEGATSDATGLFDESLTTFWQPEGLSGEFTVTLPEARRINRVTLQENIETLGQRVGGHALDAWIDGEWREVAKATTIGYKRILRFPAVTTDRFRARILGSRLSPGIATFSAHYHAPQPQPVDISRNTDGLVIIAPRQGGSPTIHYTLDGSEPDAKSPVYREPIELARGGVVKARTRDGGVDGPVATHRMGISHVGWQIVSFSSEHDAQYGAAKAIDGDPSSFWHSSWDTNQAHPHHITIDLGREWRMSGITYLPRQDQRVPDSMVESGSIEVSKDGHAWHHAADFTFDNLVNDPAQRTVTFTAPAKARFIRFNSKTGVQGKPYAGAAEIGVLATE